MCKPAWTFKIFILFVKYYIPLSFQVFSWGEGEDGKLGHNNRLSLDKPRLIESLKSKRIRDIACGSSHSAAITSNGELYTWGLGEYGRLGHGDSVTQLKPKLVSAVVTQKACLFYMKAV
jgi:E3 ubiquitin-protein ligase HERC2